MNTLSSVLTFLQVGAADPQGNLVMTGVTFGLVILIFYFLIIRPQNKKQKELEKMLTGIKKGDKVYTIGGMHGTVQSVNDEKATVVLKVDEGSTTTLEFNKSAIAGILTSSTKKEKAEDATEPKKTTKRAPKSTAAQTDSK